MIIELDDIVKRFGALTVVDHVRLTIRDGEFFTLLGPSGCGKTTLLRLIAGFGHPDSGDIRFGGESVLPLPVHRRDTGMVFQSYALFPHMTVFDNVAYGLHARKVGAADIRRRVADVLGSVQMEELADRYPRQLSGGQQQRVALARALVIRPRVLLMDEPLSNLDAKLRVSMREEIRRIQRELGITTVYVTHDQEEAMAVSDRIAIFYGGTLQQVDPPQDIYFRPVNRFTAEFMGSCTILEMTGEGRDDGGLTTARLGDARFQVRVGETAAGERLLLMLRPDWFRPAAPGDRNAFRGVVRESMFLGTAMVYRVEALGCRIRVDIPAVPGQDFFRKEGDALDLCFDPASPVRVRP